MFQRLRKRDTEEWAAWLAAGAWAVQPLVSGPLFGDALDPTGDPFRTAASWGLWVWWLLALVALGIHRPLTLAVARISVAAATPAAIWAATEVTNNTTVAIGILGAAVAGVLVLSPAVGDRFVDGSSYGSERRFALRPSGPVLLALVVPTWAATVAGAVSGPLLLADERWIPGAVLTVVGFAVAIVGFRALSQLTERFLVFVPNGLVVHDYTVLSEPVLFTKNQIANISPAPAAPTATDLTSNALGLALEVTLHESATLPRITGRNTVAEQQVVAFLVSPARPGAVMALAAARGFAIG